MDMETYRKVINARDAMLKALNNKERHWTQCACVAIVNTEKHIISTNQACHYGLKEGVISNAVATVSGLMKPPEGETLGEDEAILFLDWLLNRSPYASTFITKSAHEALFHKAIISDAFTPSNLMAAGLVASRSLWEFPIHGRVFCDLAKAGVNEDLAFFLAHLYSGTFNHTGKVSFGTYRAGHCAMNPGVMGKAELKNYLEHNVIKPNNNFNESRNYSGYDGMYGSSRAPIKDWIHDNFPYKKVVAAAKVANPFPKDKLAHGDDGKGCSYEDLIKGAVEFQHKLFEYIGFKQEEQKKAA